MRKQAASIAGAILLACSMGFAQSVTSLNPNSVRPGGPPFTLTVNGSGFIVGSVVQWNGSPLSTTYISANQLSAAVPASLIAQAGDADINVSNTPGIVSNGANFIISLALPELSTLSPNPATAGGPGFTLTVNGSGFIVGSIVLWNGSVLPTTYVNANQLSASVPSYLIAFQGSASITVQSAGGLISNTLTLTISPTTPLGITTASTLPSGSAASFYSQTLAASGGISPYTWTIVSGALPPGLTLATSGAITGTPTTIGTSQFQVQVADSANATATRAFSLAIATPSLSFSNALRVAQIADGASWKTLFAIVNLDSSLVYYAFQFWDDNGNPLALPILNGPAGVLSGTLPVGGTVFAETPGTSPTLLQGWAEVASSGRVGVLTIFRQRIPGRPDSEGTVAGTLSGNRIVLPFDNTQDQVTSVAVADTSPNRALTISLLFQFENGGQATGSLVLGAHAHTAFPLPTMFPAVAGARGSVQFSVPSADITVLGLRFSPTGSFTSVGAFQ